MRMLLFLRGRASCKKLRLYSVYGTMDRNIARRAHRTVTNLIFFPNAVRALLYVWILVLVFSGVVVEGDKEATTLASRTPRGLRNTPGQVFVLLYSPSARASSPRVHADKDDYYGHSRHRITASSSLVA